MLIYEKYIDIRIKDAATNPIIAILIPNLVIVIESSFSSIAIITPQNQLLTEAKFST